MRRALVRLTDTAVLRVRGEHSRPFLQGLLTNDVSLCDRQGSVYAAGLNAVGRFLFDAHVVPDRHNGYLVLVSDALRENVLAHMRKHRLRSKVELEDASSQLHAWVALGTDGVSVREVAEEGHRAGVHAAFVDSRLPGGELGARLVADSGVVPGLSSAFPVAGLESYHQLRTRLGVPEAVADMEPGATFVLEAGLDMLNGVSFTKGCYMGQEQVARNHFRGAIRKRIMPATLAWEDDAGRPLPEAVDRPVAAELPRDPEARALVDRGGRKVGRLLSASGNVGMVLARLADVLPGCEWLLDGAAGTQRPRPRIIPYVPAFWPDSVRATLGQQDVAVQASAT